MLDALGWIEVIDDDSRPAQIAREYAQTLQQSGTAPLVVSPTHAEGERITHAIRAELKQRKLPEAGDRQFDRLTSLNLTDAERADPAMYESGNLIVFQQNAPGHCKGERIVVTDRPDAELLKLAKRFQVYRSSKVFKWTSLA